MVVARTPTASERTALSLLWLRLRTPLRTARHSSPPPCCLAGWTPDGHLLLWRVFGKWTVHWVAPGRSPLAPLAHTATSEGGTVSKDTLLWLSHTHRKDGPSHSSGICGRVFGCRCAMRTWLLHAWTIRLAPLVHVTAFQRVDR